jgi:two-component system nitrogen regulation sensor histidine kinase NtrY
VEDRAARAAAALASAAGTTGEPGAIHDQLAALLGHGARRLTFYGIRDQAGSPAAVDAVADAVSADLPAGDPTVIDRLAAEAAEGVSDVRALEPLGPAGDLLHAAAIVHDPDGGARGVVVATDHLPGDLAARSRRMTQAFEGYNQLRVLRQPLTAMYLSFFLMVTLLILIGATWTGSYLAKHITRPVLALSAAAREIGAGRLEQRVEPQQDAEFGALVDSFNTMAGELAASRRKLERSNFEIERKHLEVEKRRRYVETILERIATGVVSADATGAITMINAAASRLLNLPRTVVGHAVPVVFDRADLRPLGALLSAEGPAREPSPREVTIAREGQELRLAVVATGLVGESGGPDGMVLVFDDVTPLIRAQKVAAWREVARRLAHEIKNPLTPIQLSAGRLRRHFQSAPMPVRTLVEECTDTIVGEVESLKGLVDEFSQFARMPSPKTVPADLGQLVTDTLALYSGLFAEVRFETHLPPGLPLVRLDPEQMRRVMINLIDNAVEAMNRRGTIAIDAQLDPSNSVVRVVVADDGPGIPPEEREKLFLPYYSTKRRGSGLGLAIVRRIIAEHGGNIEVGDNVPRGTRFTIELPC